jgi:hypothetical protein
LGLDQKLLGRLQKGLAFHKSNFYVSENFQVSMRSIQQLKTGFTKVHYQIKGACQKWRILFLDIFQRNLAHL